MRVKIFGVVSVAVACLGFLGLTTSVSAFTLPNAQACTLYGAGDAPAGWGQPWDYYPGGGASGIVPAGSWLIQSPCESSSNYGFEVVFGNAPSNYWTYEKAYVYDFEDRAWLPLINGEDDNMRLKPFDGAREGAWIKGLAHGFVSWRALDNQSGKGIYTEDNEFYIASYQCTYLEGVGDADGSWKCNCENEACTGSDGSWTLQKFDASFIN